MSFFAKKGITFTAISVIIAAINWIFWIIAAKLSTQQDIGLASSIINVATLFSSVAMLGIEISLLKNASKNKAYFGSAFLFEILLHASVLPLLVISIMSLNNNNFFYVIFALIIFFEALVISVSKYSLLGILSVKNVLTIDMLGSITKIILLILFLSWHLDLNAILLSIIVQSFIMIIPLLILSIKEFRFTVNKKTLKIILTEGLSNFPNKISNTLQFYGTIAMLAFFSISNESIAGITIAMSFFRMVIFIPSSLTTISLPSSQKQNEDLSKISMKIGMILVSPIICVMIVTPDLVLSIYNESYLKFAKILSILSISAIPFILSSNVKISLNHKGLLKKVSILGITESIIIVVTMVIFIPLIGAEAIAWSIFFTFLASGVLSFIWADSNMKKLFLVFSISTIVGSVMGVALHQFAYENYLIAVASVLVSISFLFILRLLKVSEILFFLRQMRKK